jgi:hypothetical protein
MAEMEYFCQSIYHTLLSPGLLANESRNTVAHTPLLTMHSFRVAKNIEAIRPPSLRLTASGKTCATIYVAPCGMSIPKTDLSYSVK